MQARIRFYAELNDFLPPERRMTAFDTEIRGVQTVKQLVESLGVPAADVDLVLVNGDPVGFDRVVRNGDRISVYPVFEAFDITAESRLRPRPLRQVRFVLDHHLAPLAAGLRRLGFDAVCPEDAGEEELARISKQERRILLTPDPGLIQRTGVTHGHSVLAADARRQLREVLERFQLTGRPGGDDSGAAGAQRHGPVSLK